MGAQDSRQTWLEQPFWKQVKYYFLMFCFGGLCSYIATRFFMVDFLILNFHLQHLWLFLPEGTIIFGGLYIWNWSRTSQKKKQQKQAQTELRKLLQQASGGEKKK